MSRTLIFANGAVNDGAKVQQAIAEAHADDVQPHIMAADGGARQAAHYGLAVHSVVGDMDSLAENEQAVLRANGAIFHEHSPQKDETDLELALTLARKQGADWVRVIGAMGQRIDQTLGNLQLLAAGQFRGYDVAIVDGDQSVRALHAGIHQISGQPGDTISLIPVGGAAEGVYTNGLEYSLYGETLLFGPTRGISNRLSTASASVSIRAGVLLVIHTASDA
ncbi:MAG: thiamine diphosphokinase [Anaerolineaceae bacterium]|nr:MAG: thiamine diphosphokinase [Anaerolineaceae bacterium]